MLLDVDDTANYADDSTVRIHGPVMVAGTKRYEARNGAARTVFVIKPFGAKQLPPYVAEPSEHYLAAKSLAAESQPENLPGVDNGAKEKLDPSDFEVGAIGVLPQWPVGAEKLNTSARAALARDIKTVRVGEAIQGLPLFLAESRLQRYGGRSAANGRYNLRVLQVFDERRLLVTFTGDEAPPEWPLFLLDVRDSSDFADGSTLCVDGPVKVLQTERYNGADAALRTIFVVKRLFTNSASDGASND